ncbi:putative sphingosine kinase A, B [Trypanosoma grayi]|uniref:putative sphingosine kinase A, B n=1 Tax=Trypanosoma grayi TaxID=71804 RepID=UPI0004F47A99|nr:putative sphingosine kinase A, B [Trypanosoma grayi]KEG14055.1 putative sphingosine kinase A, B [Trypanosoma grayi]
MGAKDPASRLHVWVIVNPTSGHGKGNVLLRRIEKALQREFCDGVTRVQTASDIVPRNSQPSLSPKYDCAGPASESWDAEETIPLLIDKTLPARQSGASTAKDEAIINYVRQGGLRVEIITTEKDLHGERIAEHITRNVVASRVRRCLGGAARASHAMTDVSKSDPLHVFVPVGGDGTLSETVNGMCRGTLQAFRESALTRTAGELCAGSCCYSSTYYWQLVEDKSILRHFLPTLIYISAGTGSDFARLKLCCRNEMEFVDVLRGLCGQLLSPAPSPTPSSPKEEYTPNCQSSNEEGKDVTSSFSITPKEDEAASFEFEVYDVDVGRVTFPRSGRNYFFINEFSCGMSCDVIQKCEKYKRNKVLSAAGGTVMFATASIVSVTQMRPTPFRLAPLPEADNLPSSAAITRRVASGMLHQHITADDAALRGVQCDLLWAREAAGNAALPPTEPLRTGGNYYVYSLKAAEVSPESDASNRDANGWSDAVFVNPFYTDRWSQYARKPDEIVAALGSADAHNRWVCMPSSTLVFGNGRWFGGGLQVTPHANPTDGFLSVTNWVAGFFSFVSRAPSLYNGKHTRWSSTTTWNTTRCIVDVDARALDTSAAKRKASTEEAMAHCETDGELREQLPAIVELGGVITLLVPRQCAKRSGRDGNSGKEEAKSPGCSCGSIFSRFSRWLRGGGDKRGAADIPLRKTI